jgi:hypothetical protein
MSSILPSIRSLFRDGTLPTPSFYSIKAKTNSKSYGVALTIDTPEFEAPCRVFDLVDDSHVKNGDTLTLNNLYVEMVFVYNDGHWVVQSHWTRPK